MRTTHLKYLLFLLLSPIGLAQNPSPVIPNPPCVLNFSLSSASSSANFKNSTPACDKWTLTVHSTGFSGFTLTLQDAPAATTTTPGSFVTYAGTTATGSNPMSAAGVSTFTNGTVDTPYLRVTLSGLTGSGVVWGVLQGAQSLTAKGGGGGGGGGGPTIAGTANEITATGDGCISPSTATCTIALANNTAIPGAPTIGTTPTLGDNSTKVADTAYVINAFTGCTFASGALTCPGSITSGSGSGIAGTLDLAQGTLPATFPANAFSLYAPTAIGTSYQWKVPAADPGAGAVVSDGGATPSNLSTLPFQGNGGKVQKSTGTTTTNDCVKFDANGNTVDAGAACGSGGGGGAAGATLFSTTASTTVTTTSPTTLIGAVTGSTTIPVNTFTAGQVLELVAQGYYSTPATPASLTISINVGGTIRITTGAVVQIASITNGVWRVRCMVTTRTAGSTGTQIANCIFEGTGATLTPGEAPLQTSSTWTIDTTATQALDLVATWSTAAGSPTITATNVAAWIPGAPVTSVNGQTGAVTVSGGGGQVYYFTDSMYNYAVCSTSYTGGPTGTFAGLPTCSASGTWTYYAPASGVPVTPPPSTGWTWDNQSTSTISFTNGPATMVTAAASGVDQIRVQYRAAPATPYTVTTRLTGDLSGGGMWGTVTNRRGGYGIAFSDSTGKYVIFYTLFEPTSGTGFYAGGTFKCNSATSIFTSAYNSLGDSLNNVSIVQRQYQFMQISDDGTNLTFRFSTTGQPGTWDQFDQRSRTDFLTSGPTRVAWFTFVPSSAKSDGVLMDWTVTSP